MYDSVTEKKLKDSEARKNGSHFLYTDKIRLILDMVNEFLDLELLYN